MPRRPEASDHYRAPVHVRLLILAPERFGLPTEPSTRGKCRRCKADVWVPRAAAIQPGDQLLCVVCAMSVVRVGDVIDSAPWFPLDAGDAE